MVFQSSLPRGSDCNPYTSPQGNHYFNPRSLAGATAATALPLLTLQISILAPSRERLFLVACSRSYLINFNPRSLAGATTALAAYS